MSESVSLPALGESVTEGTVTRWLKNVGDRVEVDEPLLEVSTDKVDTEIPSPVAGVIEAILVQEDETVEVGTALVTIGDGSGAAAAPGARRGCARAAAPARGAAPAAPARGTRRAGARGQPLAAPSRSPLLPRRHPRPHLRPAAPAPEAAPAARAPRRLAAPPEAAPAAPAAPAPEAAPAPAAPGRHRRPPPLRPRLHLPLRLPRPHPPLLRRAPTLAPAAT